MQVNGSPAPVFDTDEARSYFLVTLPDREAFLPLQEITDYEPTDAALTKKILLCRVPHSRIEIQSSVGIDPNAASYRKYIQPLIQLDFLQLTILDKPSSKSQRYLTTKKGEAFLQKF